MTSPGLAAVATRLANARFAGGDTVTGSLRGLEVRWRYATEGVGSGKTTFTECTVRLPQTLPLLLHIRRRDMDQMYYVRAGLAIDIKLGDRPFDRAFIVEGAPDDIVRALLTPPVRAQLVSLIGARLFNAPGELRVGNDSVVLTQPGWLEDPERAGAFADLAIAVAEQLPVALAESDARSLSKSGGAYRESPDGVAARALAVDRQQQMLQVASLRARRDRFGVKMVRLAILFVLVLAFIAVAGALIAKNFPV